MTPSRRDACVAAAAAAAAGSLAWALVSRRRKVRSGVGVALPYGAACVYLDWNATSPIFPEVTEAMLPFVGEHFGNPSSSHAFGLVCGEFELPLLSSGFHGRPVASRCDDFGPAARIRRWRLAESHNSNARRRLALQRRMQRCRRGQPHA